MSIRKRRVFGKTIPIHRAPKYLVGCDMSLRDSGISIHDNMGKEVETFHIKTPSGQSDHTSVDYITGVFFDKLEPYLKPDLLAKRSTIFMFENQYHTAGGRAGAGKSGARYESVGVLKWNLRQINVPVYSAESSSMVSYLLGKCPRKREDKKKAVMEWLHLNRNFYTNNDNMADAYALAIYAHAIFVEGKRLSYRASCQVI